MVIEGNQMKLNELLVMAKNIFLFICFVILMLSMFHIIDYTSPFAKMAEEMVEKQTGVEIIFPQEQLVRDALKQKELKDCLK